MLTFELSVELLGNTRFAFSPLAEVASSLRLLPGVPHGHIHERWWKRTHGLLSGRADAELLRAVHPGGKWVTDFLYPRPVGLRTTIDDQLADLARMPHELLAADLDLIWRSREAPAAVRELLLAGSGGPSRLAEVIQRYWDIAIEPYWTRIRGLLDDDVSRRAAQALNGGLFTLLDDLHPQVSLDGRRMLVDKPHFPDATYQGTQLTLVPSLFVWPQLVLSHDEPGMFELTYPVQGVGSVWDGVSTPPAERLEGGPLVALLGRRRARILLEISVPMSTTAIARAIEQSAGSVSQHLSVLRAAGMVTCRRSGREVFYQRTPLGASLAAMGAPDGIESIG